MLVTLGRIATTEAPADQTDATTPPTDTSTPPLATVPQVDRVYYFDSVPPGHSALWDEYQRDKEARPQFAIITTAPPAAAVTPAAAFDWKTGALIVAAVLLFMRGAK